MIKSVKQMIKNNKRNPKTFVTMLFACIFLLGFTQCKKEQPSEPNQNKGVYITLSVDGGGKGERVNVNPTGGGTYATVDFEDGDIIYVGNNGAYCGYLTCDKNNNVFHGEINPTSEDDYLHFYLLGGKGFTPTIEGNIATVNISDQSSTYPVVSYAPSKEKYSSGNGNYSARLLNKCSIMKFAVTTPSSAPICITGMNNKVTLDFSTPSGNNNGFSFSQEGEGVIKMAGGSGSPAEKWAIVLPQDALAEGAAGSVYAQNGTDITFFGTRPSLSAITANQYLDSGIALSVNTSTENYLPLSLVSSTHVGWVAGANGFAYQNASAATEAGTTAEAMIAFIGTYNDVCDHGLAISLTDAYVYNATFADATGDVIIPSWETYHGVTGASWRLPSEADWQRMMWGYYAENPSAQNISSFQSNLELAGGAMLETNNYYWTSTFVDDANARAVLYDNPFAGILDLGKGWYCRVRACLSF